MMNNHELHVELQGDYIIVTLPGHRYDARQVRELYYANAYPLKRHHPRR